MDVKLKSCLSPARSLLASMPFWSLFVPTPVRSLFRNCLRKIGGDDETRTRDLCRDSHSLDSTESVGYIGNSRQELGSLGRVGKFLFNDLFNAIPELQ